MRALPALRSPASELYFCRSSVEKPCRAEFGLPTAADRERGTEHFGLSFELSEATVVDRCASPHGTTALGLFIDGHKHLVDVIGSCHQHSSA
jgi:hypothetical protein